MANYEDPIGDGSNGIMGEVAFMGTWYGSSKLSAMDRNIMKANKGLTASPALRRYVSLSSTGVKPGFTKHALQKRFAQKGAAAIAKGYGGAYRPAAWGAAKKAGLLRPLAVLSAGKVGAAVAMGINMYLYAPMVYMGAKAGIQKLHEMGRFGRKLNFGQGFEHTKGSYTERQRSLRAITSSRMSTRAALGNEAMLMHR